jgi:23S rRNA (guanine745-N1)-methyltransferase
VRDPSPCTACLSCPVCAASLADVGPSARCAAGHSFDYARSGYLNLARQGGGRRGDTAAMVQARAELLASGHYERIAAAVASAASEAAPGAGVVAEVGSGTGYYLDAVVRRLGERGPGPGCAFGFDLSKAAAAHAARRHPGLRFAVADLEAAIPLRDTAADLLLSVFSPRPGPELGRVTRPGGELIAAFASPRHLQALRERLGLMSVEEDKQERLTERLEPWFDPVSTDAVEYEVDFAEDDARHLALMGPNAWHDVDTGGLDGPLTDLVSVVVARFRRRRD